MSGTMASMSGDQDREALIERLRLIEDQPLADRDGAYESLVDELRAALEAADERG